MMSASPNGLTDARPDHSPLSRAQLALWASGEHVWEWVAATNRITIDRFDSGADGQPLLDAAGQPCPLAEQLDIEDFFARAHADDRATLRLAWRLHLRGVHPDVDVTFRWGDASPRTRWMRLRGRALGAPQPGPAQRVLGTLKDVTDQRDAEESLRLMAHAFASTRDAMVVVDAQWQVLEVNDALRRLCADHDLAQGADLQRWIGPAPGLLDQVLLDGLWRGERALRSSQGTVPVEMSLTAVVASDGDRHCFLVALHDLRERRLAEERLHTMATVDRLTGLPNRLATQWQVEQLLSAATPAFGLMLIDLDGFKELNDSYGHQHGDLLLVSVAQRLRSALGAEVFMARWGSDEFALVLPGSCDDTPLRAAAQLVLATMAQPFLVGCDELSVTPTLGAVLAPQDGADFNTLVRKADLAVYAGKDRGRNRLVFYEAALESDAQRRVRMTSLLRVDTDRNGFRFVAQPKVDATGRPVGAELLMRWTTEAFGSVSPMEFIPLAEKVGLIQLMGRHAAHAAAQLAAGCAEVGRPLPVAVNLSPKQLQQPGLDELLLHACRRYGIAPQMLELELTESALVHNMDVVEPMLRRLRAQGFSLALDDFGTGYSSLSYLRHLPFDKVKIDRSFVMDLDRDPAAARMLESIVQLCVGLDKRIVAEGVETPQQAAMLAALGVHEFQGYHFARPMPVDDWLDLLRAQRGQPLTLPLV